MLDNNGNIRIVDFGLSNLYDKFERLKTACGSPCYAAPEMIAGLPYDGIKVKLLYLKNVNKFDLIVFYKENMGEFVILSEIFP